MKFHRVIALLCVLIGFIVSESDASGRGKRVLGVGCKLTEHVLSGKFGIAKRFLTTSPRQCLPQNPQSLISEVEQKIAPFAEAALDRYGKGVFSGKKVLLRHVGPRDGEQAVFDVFSETSKNDSPLEAETKIAHNRYNRVQLLRVLGFQEIEVGTYGKTKLTSMKPSGKVLELLRNHYKSLGHAGFSFLTLTPDNLRAFFKNGGERAAIVVGATDDFNQRNLGKSTGQLISGMNDVLKDGLADYAIDGRMHPLVDLYISNAFSQTVTSKSDGKNLRKDVRSVMKSFKGCVQRMILSDTHGTATPRGVVRLLASLEKHKVVHMEDVGLHLHRRADGMEMDSLIAALRYGVTCFDVGYHAENLGGCPAVLDPSAQSDAPIKRKHLPNISDLMTVLMLERLGISTGINPYGLAKFNADLMSKLSER